MVFPNPNILRNAVLLPFTRKRKLAYTYNNWLIACVMTIYVAPLPSGYLVLQRRLKPERLLFLLSRKPFNFAELYSLIHIFSQDGSGFSSLLILHLGYSTPSSPLTQVEPRPGEAFSEHRFVTCDVTPTSSVLIFGSSWFPYLPSLFSLLSSLVLFWSLVLFF